MKKLYYLFFILLTVTSCQEDPLTPYEDAKPNFTGETFDPDGGGNGGGGTTGNNKMTATIDGQSWEGNMILGIEMAGNVSIAGTNIVDGSQLAIAFDEGITVGTHNFDMLTTTAVFSYNTTQPPVNYKADGPALEIISIDTANNSVKGVFSFEATNINDATDVIKITNGEFNATYSTFSF